MRLKARGIYNLSKGVWCLGFFGIFKDFFEGFLGFFPKKCTGFFHSYLPLEIKSRHSFKIYRFLKKHLWLYLFSLHHNSLRTSKSSRSKLSSFLHSSSYAQILSSLHSFLSEQFYNNIEGQISCEKFPKTRKSSKFERGNLPNERLDQYLNM